MTSGTPLLALEGISKRFPGVVANDDIDLNVKPGEIHALLGENGAGKSTLVKIIYGVLAPDSGVIRWQGQPVRLDRPAAARRLGIGMVFQHFSLFDSMTVLENVALALDGVRDMKALRARLTDVSAAYGLPLNPDREVHTLSVGERQRVEIVRCLLQNPKLLILDEPTSVLTVQETDRLFQTLRQLAAEGCAILYISHKLAEVKALCQRATVLRQGRVVAERDPRAETARSLAELMIGRRLVPPQRREGVLRGAPVLEVEKLGLKRSHRDGVDLEEVSFALRSGEILGIAGIAGNGQSELMAALSGEAMLPKRPEAIRIGGVGVAHLGPAARRARGAVFVPEERRGHAAVTQMPLTENALLTAHERLALAKRGWIATGRTAEFADRVIVDYDVRTRGVDAEAGSLSGGNLQKFVVGRELSQEPVLLVIAQPTWGVDAGAAAIIHQSLIDLAGRGGAVLMISQDLDEIFEICDRVAVISDGRLAPARPIAAVTAEEIGLLMGGLHDLAAEAAADA
jgi:simple sugar transport system ATP-binding protein